MFWLGFPPSPGSVQLWWVMCEGKGTRQKPNPVLCLRSHTGRHYIPGRCDPPLCSCARFVDLTAKKAAALNPGLPHSCRSSKHRRMMSCSLQSRCWFRNEYLFILSGCSLFLGRWTRACPLRAPKIRCFPALWRDRFCITYHSKRFSCPLIWAISRL